MNKDDFFIDDNLDHTQIYPMPGGRQEDLKKILRAENESSDNIRSEYKFNDNSYYSRTKYNSLSDAASNLLILLGHISNTLENHDSTALKKKISVELNEFSKKAESLGFGRVVISDATYVLCTAIDEAVLNTPWGERSGWSQNTLLNIYHGNVVGGNTFFDRLKSLGEDPKANHQLLGIMYYALALGYQGRYRSDPTASQKLSQIRNWTAEKIRPYIQLQSDPYLSLRWKGIKQKKSLLPSFIPKWLIGVITLLLLVGLFSFFYLNLVYASSTVVAEMQELYDKPPPIEVKIIEPYIPKPTLPRLSVVFKDEKRLNIQDDDPTHTSIRILSDSLFKSGSDTFDKRVIPLLEHLSEEINIRPGQIKVTGHTDNVSISSRLKLRFPTNQVLSQARANSVANIITNELDIKKRISTQGKGSNVPLVDNKTSEGRSKNRRVEIDIYN